MKLRNRSIFIWMFIVVNCGWAIVPAHAADELAWPPTTSQTRPWAYWWWMGSAVDKTNITRELQRYHDGGLGGVHIIPIYGARGFESNYLSYLSPKWMEMMSWSVTEANRLGMGVDMTTGTGWCFGGPKVTDEDANASVVVKIFELGVGERIKEKLNPKTTQALIAFPKSGNPVDLTSSITTNGEVFFSPPGNWTGTGTETNPPKTWKVYAISQKPSGQKVKRPAPGGEGWMLNLFSPPAMTNYLNWFSGAFDDYSGAKPRAQYHDSYEYKSDWSPTFFAEFEKRRGYRLQGELPSLFGGNRDDHAARVLYDYRRTVSDIMTDETLPQWVKWSHDHGFITREEAHGSPGNWLDLYATADIPETEFFSKHRNILVSKFASSAAHVKGGNLASSESCTWLSEHFTETLGGVKGLMDELFLSGINHVFYHGCCYSPDEAGWPGWHFYASTEMNPRNSIWHDAPALNDYIARVQSVLQSGKSDNDILLYWPLADFWSEPGNERLPQLRVEAQGWFEEQSIGKAAHKLWNEGFSFDYVSDRQLLTAKVDGHQVHMPGGDYQVIFVPECKYMPLETLKQLVALAKNGATVIFENRLPLDVPGLRDLEKQRAEFQQLASMFGGAENKIGRGKVLIGDSAAQLKSASVRPEVMTGSNLVYVRRTSADGWNYLIVNRGNADFDGWLPLARSGRSAVILDPMTTRSGLAAYRTKKDTKEIHLNLPSGSSTIVHVLKSKKVKKPSWPYWQSNSQPMEITGQWNINFLEGGPSIPASFQSTKLGSWTQNGDTNAQNFAGTAKYELTFDAPDSAGKNYSLDLGDVRQSARVRVNGKDYGTLITKPFRVVVGDLKPMGNHLEVEITSVAANRIRDLDRRRVPWKTFRDINFVDIDYKPFDASNWPITECGLLGPVTLTAVKSE